MPFTYNGIGTRYYGKQNLDIHPGVCRSCGRQVQLQSYDTRLWFVILYIPIIPLARKRILEYCPSCRRHYAPNLDKWETARQLETSGAMEKYRSNPTPENAIAAHQQLLGFHQVAEATEFQKTMAEKFPDNAKVQAYLGSALDHMGRRDQAVEFYKRALELRSDLPEARVGLARGYIRAGQLGEARRMLDFLEKSGSAQLYSLEPLETLAYAYQNRGEHREALDLFEKLLQELPKIAEHPAFRKAVKKSEKALGQDRTILPKQKFNLKRMLEVRGRGGQPVFNARSAIAVGVLLAVIILGFGISNEYIRHHREIFVVNGFDTPADVRIPGVGELHKFKGLTTFSLPEGHFHAVVSGPVKDEFDFDIRDTYFNRWFGHPVWVINVGGGALLDLEEAVYSQNPQPPNETFYFGQNFQEFPNVTHPFQPLPNKVQVESGGTKTLVGLNVFKGDATDLFAYYRKINGVNNALDFAERWLRVRRDDDMMLLSYQTVGQRDKQANRVDAFLRVGLTNRPLSIAWHRAYQNLHSGPADRAAIVSQYDDMLQADPTNSALLYLRGRIETNRTAARDFLTRSGASDPNNPYAFFALGYDRMTSGDWQAARPYLVQAVRLSPHDDSFASLLFIDRLAVGDASALERELRTALMRDPMNVLLQFELIDTLAAQDKTDQARTAADNFVALCKSRYADESGQELIDATRFHTWYAVGDFKALKSAAATNKSSAGQTVSAMALIEEGQPDEAARLLPAQMDTDDREILYFSLAIAYRLNGNDTAAAQWRSKGIELLKQGNEDECAAAELFGHSAGPSRAQAEDVTISPQLKAVLLTELSQEYSQSRTELAAYARTMNVNRGFPYHLVQRVTAGQ